MKLIYLSLLACFAFCSCKKEAADIAPIDTSAKTDSTLTRQEPAFTKYIIEAGNQYCNNSVLQLTNYSSLHFKVKFDSSAIYKTANPVNQLDINKLYGFSDNNANHQEYSARFGWRWYENEVQVFAYVYNDARRSFSKIASIVIGKEYDCKIEVKAGKYVFSLGDKTLEVSRSSRTTTAEGYKLYPYFGGDEAAPHDINIFIEELTP